MANDYPFSPYPDPFSLSVTPEVPKTPEELSPPISPPPFSEQSVTPAAATPVEENPPFSEQPVVPATPPFSEPPEDLEDEVAKKTALTIVFGVLIVLALSGVGVWYFFLRDSSTLPPPPPPAESPQEEPGRDPNLILAALGGMIVTSDGAALTIPAGALSQDTKLEILKVENGEVTDLYELKPTGLKFAKPVTVSIPYKESGLKKNETPYHIILEYWKDEGEAKRALKYTVDKKEKKLKTQVREF